MKLRFDCEFSDTKPPRSSPTVTVTWIGYVWSQPFSFQLGTQLQTLLGSLLKVMEEKRRPEKTTWIGTLKSVVQVSPIVVSPTSEKPIKKIDHHSLLSIRTSVTSSPIVCVTLVNSGRGMKSINCETMVIIYWSSIRI